LTKNLITNNTFSYNIGLQLYNKTFFIKTYGCQMNVNDSLSAKAMFEELGMKETQIKEDADLIMISTCCVREKAELKVHSYIGLLKAIKKKNKDLIIIISGCMSEQRGVKKDLFSRFPFIDIVVGTGMIPMLPDYISKKLETERKINYELELITEFKIPTRNAKRVSEFVTIMTGCNNYCSYCIVPYVRGRETSRDVNEIISEINKFVADGCKEVTLLGQNVNSYGLDKGGLTFTDLLKKVAHETDIDRVRFMTSHPKDLTDEVLELIASEKKLCNHIHLPLQSGSDSLLAKMNRKYDIKRYLHIVDYARMLMPDVEFTTDIIVGFPGETDKDFDDTLDIVKKVRFASAYMFKFSKRSGTPAAEYENQVEKSTKEKRLSILMDVETDIKKEICSTYLGTVQEILVEGQSHSSDTYMGKTSSAVTVNFKGTKEDIGQLINVKITQSKTNTLFAIKIKEN